MKRKLFLLASILVLGGAGCATAQVPNQTYTPGEQIADAEQQGAEDLPEAKQHLKAAKKQFSEAQQFKKDGNAEEANLHMMKAQSDADYALALLGRKSKIQEVAQVREEVETLRQQLNQTRED